jgi:hypothetical protein
MTCAATTAPDYEILGPLGGTELRLRFRGPYAGQEITWDAHFMTRSHYGTETMRNFIDIGAKGPHGRQLTVVLDVNCFDTPTLRKAIIMVRQYRRLRPGRHEFGSPAS